MAVFKYPRYAKFNKGSIADGGVALANLVDPLVQSLRLDDQARMGVLIDKWKDAVGAGIAAHTRPGKLFNKELTIFVDSSPWLSELQRNARKDLLAKLQKVFGREMIQAIRLSMDPGQSPSSTP